MVRIGCAHRHAAKCGTQSGRGTDGAVKAHKSLETRGPMFGMGSVPLSGGQQQLGEL